MNTDLIRSDPSIMMGKPVVAGTRLTVELILEKLAAGESMEQILDAHPRLTREAILAAQELSARVAQQTSAYERLLPFIGIVDEGEPHLSGNTGERLRELLENKQRARRSF